MFEAVICIQQVLMTSICNSRGTASASPAGRCRSQVRHNSGAELSFNDLKQNSVDSIIKTYFKVITYITIDVK